MFRNAATKLAHNSTLPALVGNNDLRPLQDLITAEKAVLLSIQKLSHDLTKSSEALRTWGIGEGDDLGDILSASTTILSSFSHALTQYGTHEHAIRDHMKSIRSREEGLDELKRRRRTVVSKAEAAERKLSKLSPEHKNLAMQTDTLNRLRDEIRVMDSDIMSEEASLGDFKRTTSRAMMGLKFGGLLELCEKGTIIGEYGKLITGEIPEDTTDPGMPRRMYDGHNKVETLVSEAYKCVNEVGFSTIPSRPMERPRFEQTSMSPPSLPPPLLNRDLTGGSFLGSPQGLGTGHFFDPSDMSASNMGPTSPVHNQSPTQNRYPPDVHDQSPTHNRFPADMNHAPSSYNQSPTHNRFPEPTIPTSFESSRSVDDFGVNQRTEPVDTNAGRFATFPVKNSARGYTLRDDPPMISTHTQPDMSFSSSIAEALGSTPIQQTDEPAPSYEVSHSHLYSPPQGPPPGAASSDQNPWRSSAAPSEDVELAYMSNPEDGPNAESNHTRQDSKNMVRFGSVRDIDTEIAKRHDEGHYAPDGQEHSYSHPHPHPHPHPQMSPAVVSPEDEERERNAAAAREVSRELDALAFSPPPGPVPREPSRSPPPTSPVRLSASPPRSPGAAYVNREPSPLIPPSAPFHQTLPDIDSGAPPTAAQSYAQSHRRSGSFTLHDGPTSPLAENRALPSPFESRVSTSPLAESRPLPPTLSFADRSIGRDSFQTPPEFPAPRPPFGGGGRLRSASSTSVNSIGSSTTAPSGTRTISAAAFRRPPPRVSSNGSDFGVGGPADTAPLTFKKRLPSSPYPAGGPGAARGVTTSSSLARAEARPDSVAKSEDEDFDYIGAYTNDNGSPSQADFGSLGAVNVVNRAPTGHGYGEGRFATDLEGDQLR